MKETRRDVFVREAEMQTQKALDALWALSKCAVKYRDECTPEDVKVIFSAIHKQLKATEEAFGQKRFTLRQDADAVPAKTKVEIR